MLSPMSLSRAIIVHRCRWYGRKIYHRCCCHRPWMLNLLPDQRHRRLLKIRDKDKSLVTLTLVINLSVVLLTQPNSLSPVSLSSLINIHSRLSPQIFEKSSNDPNGILRGSGDIDSWKKLKSKISCQTSFKCLTKALFYYRKTYALICNWACKPGLCIRRRSGTHVIPTFARSE